MDFVKNNKWPILAVLAILLVVGWLIWDRYALEARLQKSETLTAAEAQDKAILKDKLKLATDQQAEQVQKAVAKAMSGQRQPTTTYVYSSTTAQNNDQAAGEIKTKINNKDPSLPPDALLKSDRTAVVAGEAGGEYNVGVFKIWTAPKTLKGPSVGFTPMTDGYKPSSVGYIYLKNIKSTDKPPNYWGVMGEVGRSDGKDRAEIKIINLR